MPSNRWVQTLTGLSSTAGFPIYFPDYMVRPFALTVEVTSTNSSNTYNVEHTLDYGTSVFVSTAANWFQNSTQSGATANLLSNYAFPVTAIRLNVTAGSSQNNVTMTIVQAG